MHIFQIGSSRDSLILRCKGRLPLGEAFLRVGAIIAEFNKGSYGVAR